MALRRWYPARMFRNSLRQRISAAQTRRSRPRSWAVFALQAIDATRAEFASGQRLESSSCPYDAIDSVPLVKMSYL